ncbi:hypothetical protein K402DRAFT_326174 [Aulographum hederae CBS 113979]|uniref:MARVEL domain-containing protein n=1 Tax=Aulographum hederae CBS 113979 TaxID=1176131 RepID=A0A6G1H8Z0_9PEZI|nr:hypothetical protein K402DRAFT_326174 [Aulographum hederae CBS 113979]
MAFNYVLPIRAAQGLLTIIILGLMAYVVNSWSTSADNNFLLFCSIWTILALVYLVVTPGRYPEMAHKYGILAAEAVTMIFWFAGFIAVAVLLTDVGCRDSSICSAAIAADVFAAFEWLLFAATTIMAALHVYRTKDNHSAKHDPAMEIQP